MGPRTDDELPTGSQIKTLLQRVGDTLVCKKVPETYKCNRQRLVFKFTAVHQSYVPFISELSFQLWCQSRCYLTLLSFWPANWVRESSLIDFWLRWNYMFMECSGLNANGLILFAVALIMILFKCLGSWSRSSMKSSWYTDLCVCVCVRSVSAELPVVSLSERGRGGGVVVGPSSGSEPPVRSLLEQLVELWEGECCSSTPLHLLFTTLTVTAVLKASDTEVRLPLLLCLIHSYVNVSWHTIDHAGMVNKSTHQ